MYRLHYIYMWRLYIYIYIYSSGEPIYIYIYIYTYEWSTLAYCFAVYCVLRTYGTAYGTQLRLCNQLRLSSFASRSQLRLFRQQPLKKQWQTIENNKTNKQMHEILYTSRFPMKPFVCFLRMFSRFGILCWIRNGNAIQNTLPKSISKNNMFLLCL